MKTEITLENKAKFFSKYYGQNVLWNDNGDKKVMPTTNWCTVQHYGKFNDWCCLLKSISSITDEDIKGMIDDEFWNTPDECFYYYSSDKQVGIKRFIESLTPADSDYLRSKGYALPWMSLSVEDMVNSGWVKLKN